MTLTHDQKMLQNANELIKTIGDANHMLKAENRELRERCAFMEHKLGMLPDVERGESVVKQSLTTGTIKLHNVPVNRGVGA